MLRGWGSEKLQIWYQMIVEKPKPKQLLRPITIGAASAMNQSQFLAITCNSLEAREKSQVHGAIGFVFASHWLKIGATLLNQPLSVIWPLSCLISS